MGFQENQLVRVKSGEHDQGYGDETGRVIQINLSPVTGILVTDFPIENLTEEAEAYQVAFPALERWTDSKWYTEDQLEEA
jgi:hypothetical protein